MNICLCRPAPVAQALACSVHTPVNAPAQARAAGDLLAVHGTVARSRSRFGLDNRMRNSTKPRP